MGNILPPNANEFWSKPARDMVQILITFGGYDRKELLNRLTHKVTIRNKLIQERHVLQVAQEMRDELL